MWGLTPIQSQLPPLMLQSTSSWHDFWPCLPNLARLHLSGGCPCSLGACRQQLHPRHTHASWPSSLPSPNAETSIHHSSTFLHFSETQKVFLLCCFIFFLPFKKVTSFMEDIIKTLKQLEKTQNRTVKIPPNPTTQDKARVSVLVNILQTSLSLSKCSHDL